MTPQELSDRIAAVLVEVTTWTADPRDWGRADLDGAGEVWDRLDRLIVDLTILRRDHAVVLARRIDDQQTLYTRDGSVTVHRDVPRNEQWDGHSVIGELAAPMVTVDGEVIAAVPVDVLRDVLPACGPGATSSRWKVTALRQVLPSADEYREVTYGDAVIARGPIPSRVRNAKPPTSPQPEVQPVDEVYNVDLETP